MIIDNGILNVFKNTTGQIIDLLFGYNSTNYNYGGLGFNYSASGSATSNYVSLTHGITAVITYNGNGNVCINGTPDTSYNFKVPGGATFIGGTTTLSTLNVSNNTVMSGVLDVNGDVVYPGNTTNFAFYAYNGSVSTGTSITDNSLIHYSIRAANRIFAGEFDATSDKRIKKDI